MRLEKLQAILEENSCPYDYAEEDDLGSIDFVYRGVSYHIWEFRDGEAGAETNLRNAGRSEDVLGEYEGIIAELLKERLVS